MTYPVEFREKVISYILEGGSKASASKIYKISLNTIHHWWSNRANLSPKRTRNFGSWKLDRAELIRIVEERPDIMLKELAKILNVAINTVCHSLKVLGYTRKKNGTLQREKTL